MKLLRKMDLLSSTGQVLEVEEPLLSMLMAPLQQRRRCMLRFRRDLCMATIFPMTKIDPDTPLKEPILISLRIVRSLVKMMDQERLQEPIEKDVLIEHLVFLVILTMVK
jgi:hypothetical protein